MHAAGGLRRAAGFRNTREQAASGTQLGDAEEKIGIGRQGDGDLVEGGWRVKALALASAQIGHKRRQHCRQLLCLAGAGLVIGPAIRHQGLDLGHCASVSGKFGGNRACAISRIVEGTGLGQDAERVVVEGGVALALVDVVLAPDLEQAAGHIHGVFAAIERDGTSLQRNPLERGG